MKGMVACSGIGIPNLVKKTYGPSWIPWTGAAQVLSPFHGAPARCTAALDVHVVVFLLNSSFLSILQKSLRTFGLTSVVPHCRSVPHFRLVPHFCWSPLSISMAKHMWAVTALSGWMCVWKQTAAAAATWRGVWSHRQATTHSESKHVTPHLRWTSEAEVCLSKGAIRGH